MDGLSDRQVTRLLDINAAGAAAAVLGLRREIAGLSEQWTLGAHGTFELDAAFVGLTLTGDSAFGHQRITTTGRLWPAGVLMFVPVEVTLASTTKPPTELTITAEVSFTGASDGAVDPFHALAQAAVDELAEELLFHARAAAELR